MSTVKTVMSVRPIPCRSPPQRTYRPQTSDNRIIPVTLTYRVGWFDKGRKLSPYLTTIHPLLLCSIMLQQLPKFYPSHSTVRVFKRIAWIIRSFRDHCTFLRNCPPTPPLSQHKQVLLGYGKMMAYGRSRLAVSQKRINSGAWHEVRKWEKKEEERERERERERVRRELSSHSLPHPLAVFPDHISSHRPSHNLNSWNRLYEFTHLST